jgi:hypothetical protein
MTAHTRTEHGLAVAFHRGGEETDREVAATCSGSARSRTATG